MTSAGRRLGWSALAAFAPQAIQFAALIILARLLSPADFGEVAIAITVSEFATLLLTSGLSSYVVHVRSINQSQISTTFWVNLLLGALIGTALIASSGLIAELFNTPAVSALIAVSALGSFVSVGATHLGLLQRQYRFRAIASVETISSLTTQSVAVLLAILGMGPFSIVWGRLSGQIVQVSLYIALAKWLPTFEISRNELVEMWRYTRHVLGFNAINYWSRNIDNILIARSSGSEILGLYSRAYTIMLFPVSLVSGSIGRVLLPTVARQQHDLRLAMTTWTNYTLLSLLVGLPAASFCLAAPEVIMGALLGDQWKSAGIFLQILAVSIVPQLAIRPMGFVFQALGHTRPQLLIGIVTTILSAAFMLLGNFLAGAVGVAAGFTVSYLLHGVIYFVYARWQWPWPSAPLYWPALRLLVAAGIAAALATLAKSTTENLPIFGQFAIVAFTIIAGYSIAVFTVARSSARSALRLLKGGAV